MTEKLDLNSLNITEERKAQLKQIFPEIFTENKVDFDKLKMALGDEVEENSERYEMNWAGKKEAFKQVQIPSIGTLRPCKEESVNFDETENLYIEGDNLEVLKLLQKSYYGKIKMIYIDPPYNTGKDFVYKDNFKDNLQNYLELTGQVDGEGKRISANKETAGRYHSNWLNMMYPRLFLARNLLKDDGVIFISIDDNEVHNLRKICDEIFGEENFVNQFIWKKNSSGKTVSKQFPTNIEYVLMFAKNSNELRFNTAYKPLAESTIKMYSKDDNDGRGKYRLYPMQKTSSPGPETTYDYIDNNGKIWDCPEKGWRMVQSKMKALENDGRLVLNNLTISEKAYWNERENDGQVADTLWDDLDEGNIGTGELKKIFGEFVFDFPKPVNFLNRPIHIGSDKDSIILDFFSGSATTAHAVMQLNAEDGGNRKYIMVQLPETTDENSEAYKAGYKNICEIGKERIRRAGAKISEELKSKNMKLKLGEEPKNIKLDTGFKVLKLDTSNFKEWDNKPQNLFEQLEKLKENTKAGRTQDDILYEIILKSGLSLSEKIETKELNGKKIFSIMNGFLIICLEKELTLDFIRAIAEQKPAKVVFLDIGFHNNDQLKTNAVQIMKSVKYDGENSIECKTV